MIITKDSIFNKIPANLDQRQIFLIEGIRYCANSIYLSYAALYNELEFISSTQTLRDQSNYIVFKESWNQIDSTYRLTNLIKSISANPLDVPVAGGDFEYLLKTKPFRNTFQHIDERIDEVMLQLNAPVWGSISWVKFINENLVKSYVLSAGHPRNDFATRIVNPAGQEFLSTLDKITIQAVQKNSTEPVNSIELSELYRRTEKKIKKLEQTLSEQLTAHTVNGILSQDMLLCLDIAF